MAEPGRARSTVFKVHATITSAVNTWLHGLGADHDVVQQLNVLNARTTSHPIATSNMLTNQYQHDTDLRRAGGELCHAILVSNQIAR
jgi:hypothetical protein